MIIVIEGTDASGKKTQIKKLEENLRNLGLEVERVAFPRYDNEASVFERNYLAGLYSSDPLEISAKEASLFYSLDRYDYFKQKKTEPEVLLTDRYTTSNILHQGAKLCTEEREKYIDWIKDLEYKTLSIPEPDMVLFLNMPENLTDQLLLSRNRKRDIHETSRDYKNKVSERAMRIAKEESWSVIDCVKDSQLRSVDDIQEEILSKVKEKLNV